MRKLAQTALALLALAATSVAQAQSMVESRASISNFSMRLIDLDLNDGIEPSITWDTNRSYLGTVVYSLTNSEYIPAALTDPDPHPQEIDLPSLLAGQPSTYTLPIGGATLDLQPGLWSASTEVKTSPMLNEIRGGQDDRQILLYLTSKGPGFAYDMSFALSPKTLLIFEGLASTYSSVDTQTLVSYLQTHPGSQQVGGGYLIKSNRDAYANSYAGLHMSLGDPLPESDLTAFFGVGGVSNSPSLDLKTQIALGSTVDTFFTGLLDSTQATVIEKKLSQPFELSFVNAENNTKNGRFNLNISVGSTAYTRESTSYLPIDTPGVPEPGTWALMGLGMVGLSWATRRQRQG